MGSVLLVKTPDRFDVINSEGEIDHVRKGMVARVALWEQELVVHIAHIFADLK